MLTKDVKNMKNSLHQLKDEYIKCTMDKAHMEDELNKKLIKMGTEIRDLG